MNKFISLIISLVLFIFVYNCKVKAFDQSTQWTTHVYEGKTYYYNKVTGQSQWEEPIVTSNVNENTVNHTSHSVINLRSIRPKRHTRIQKLQDNIKLSNNTTNIANHTNISNDNHDDNNNSTESLFEGHLVDHKIVKNEYFNSTIIDKARNSFINDTTSLSAHDFSNEFTKSNDSLVETTPSYNNENINIYQPQYTSNDLNNNPNYLSNEIENPNTFNYNNDYNYQSNEDRYINENTNKNIDNEVNSQTNNELIDNENNEIERLNNEINKLIQTNNQLNNNIKSKVNNINKLNKQVISYKSNYKNIQSDYQIIKSLNKKYSNNILQLNKQIDLLNQKLKHFNITTIPTTSLSTSLFYQLTNYLHIPISDIKRNVTSNRINKNEWMDSYNKLIDSYKHNITSLMNDNSRKDLIINELFTINSQLYTQLDNFDYCLSSNSQNNASSNSHQNLQSELNEYKKQIEFLDSTNRGLKEDINNSKIIIAYYVLSYLSIKFKLNNFISQANEYKQLYSVIIPIINIKNNLINKYKDKSITLTNHVNEQSIQIEKLDDIINQLTIQNQELHHNTTIYHSIIESMKSELTTKVESKPNIIKRFVSWIKRIFSIKLF